MIFSMQVLVNEPWQSLNRYYHFIAEQPLGTGLLYLVHSIYSLIP